MILKPRKTLVASMACAAGMAVAGTAPADMLLFDFNDATPGSPDASSVVYNVLGGAAIAGVGNGNNRLTGDEAAANSGGNATLIDGLTLTDGTAFSGDLIFQDASGAVNIGQAGERLASESTPYTLQAAWDAFFFSGNNADSSAAFRVTDLLPNETYTVRFFAGVPDNGSAPANDFDTGFTTNGGSVSVIAEGNSSVVVSLSATSDALGNLDFAWEKPGTTGAVFLNVVEIDGVIVPEPASLALIGLGSLLVLPGRGRRRAS